MELIPEIFHYLENWIWKLSQWTIFQRYSDCCTMNQPASFGKIYLMEGIPGGNFCLVHLQRSVDEPRTWLARQKNLHVWKMVEEGNVGRWSITRLSLCVQNQGRRGTGNCILGAKTATWLVLSNFSSTFLVSFAAHK